MFKRARNAACALPASFFSSRSCGNFRKMRGKEEMGTEAQLGRESWEVAGSSGLVGNAAKGTAWACGTSKL